MSKLILTALGATAALGLTACGQKTQDNNVAVENVEDLNTTADMKLDMNATDMNATDMNATTGNETTGNSTGY